jgi:hypothetical protein
MSTPTSPPVKGSIKTLLLWLGFLTTFFTWGFAFHGVLEGLLRYYFPQPNDPIGPFVRDIILMSWPSLAVGTLSMFGFGALLVHGARAEPNALQVRSRRNTLSIILLLLSLYGLERITALTRYFLEGTMPPTGVLLGILISLIWTVGSAYGLYAWLQGYWEQNRSAQRNIMIFTGAIVAAMLALGYIVLQKIPAPSVTAPTTAAQARSLAAR